MAPKHATTDAQDGYGALCPLAPKHTTDGPQQREYSCNRPHGGYKFRSIISDDVQ